MKTYDPNELHSVEDNIEAMKLIVDQGILDLMVPQPGGMFVAHGYQTEHHWCLATYHCGHELEKENGYAVYMVPKSKWNMHDAMLRFGMAIAETTEGITFGFKNIGALGKN